MAPRLAFGCVASIALLLACGESNAFTCSSDAQCVRDREHGTCEATGFCSFPDDTCPSGQRYGAFAGDGLAGRCVDAFATEGTGGSSDPTTASTTPTEMTTTSTATSASTSVEESSSGIAPPMPVCGDGIVEGGEACDDGDDEVGDGCNPDCVESGTLLCTELSESEVGLDNFAMGVAFTGGDFVITGWEETASEGESMLLRRYAIDCAPVWKTSWDDAGDERGYGVTVGPEGTIWTAGSFTPMPLVPSRNVARFDGNGEFLGASPSDLGTAHAIALGPAGVVVVAGTSGTGTAGVVSWVGSYDVDGAFLGELLSASGEVDRARDIAVDGALAVYVSGSRGMDVVSAADLVVDRVDVAGFVELVRLPPKSGIADGQTIALGPDGDVFVGGYVQTMPEGPETVGPRDAYVARYAPDGTLVWADVTATDATDFSDEIEAIAIAPNTDVIVAGFLNMGVAGDAAFWVRRYTADGDVVWDVTHDQGSGGDVLRSVAFGPDGQLALAGEVQGDDGTVRAWVGVMAP